MPFRSLVFAAVAWCAAAGASHAQVGMPVSASDFLPLSQIKEARRQAIEQHKPIGFLMTYVVYFADVGTRNINHRGSGFTTQFYQEFKNRCILVNVDRGEIRSDNPDLPGIVFNAWNDAPEAKTAPCLCVVNPTFTKVLGVMGVWKFPDEREQNFVRLRAAIDDKGKWWEDPKPLAAAATPAPGTMPPGSAPGAPRMPSTRMPPMPPVPPPAMSPAAVSSAFAREMELTRQAELQQQQQRQTKPGAASATPTP